MRNNNSMFNKTEWDTIYFISCFKKTNLFKTKIYFPRTAEREHRIKLT